MGEARKLVFAMMLRNPTDRLFSNFFHKKKCCLGEMTYYEWIDGQIAEAQACAREHPGRPLWPHCGGEDDLKGLTTGLYAQQLRHWLRYFAPEQFLLIPFGGFLTNPARAVEALAHRAGIPFSGNWKPGDMKRKNAKTPGDQTMPEDLRARADAFYAPHNADLRALIARHGMPLSHDLEQLGMDVVGVPPQ